MERIKKAYRPTGEKCDCTKGEILEIFSMHYGESNGIIGPGHHTPSWVESDGFGCDSCDRQYGEPKFKKTSASQQVEFELSLSEATLKRKIELSDLEPLSMYKTTRKKEFIVAGMKVSTGTLSPISKKQTKIPAELKKFKIGSTIYVLPSHDPYHNPHNRYVTIQVSKEKDSQRFTILGECLK